jgi:hypothetical protein
MRSLSLLDAPFLIATLGGIPRDDMEGYSDLAFLDALNGGARWTGAYAARTNFMGVQAEDDMESYTDGADVDSLNGGSPGWTGAYQTVVNYTGLKAQDDMESYTDLANLNGQNGGVGWTAAYVAR